MTEYTKEYVSDLFYETVDAIIIVDAQNDSYHTVKQEGLFATFLEADGNYKNLVEAVIRLIENKE